MTIEQATLERIRVLSLEKQQDVLDFADLLVWRSQVAAKHRWSSNRCRIPKGLNYGLFHHQG
jgi:hypothetical protein